MKYKSFHLLCEDMNILKDLYPGIYEKLFQLSKAFVFIEDNQFGSSYYRVDISVKEKRKQLKLLCADIMRRVYFGNLDFTDFMVLSDLHLHLILLL